MMTIEKYLPDGTLHVVYTGELASSSVEEIVIHARWERVDRDLGYTIFQTGDAFTEYFYPTHAFNIMQITSVTTGTIKGWYCNVTRPATITGDVVAYVDLYLDVWVAADGAMLILDEDEFATADLGIDDRQTARKGLAEIQDWVAHRRGPFAILATDGGSTRAT